MTNGKRLFMRPAEPGKQSLAQWWVSVVNDDRFPMVVAFLMSDAFENGMTEAQANGARQIISNMATFADNEEAPTKFPKSGLHHNFNVPKASPEQPAPDKKA